MTSAYLLDPPVDPLIVPLPVANLRGGGRDPGFELPQYFYTREGRRTAFADSGTAGPAVLFVHGLAGNSTHWVHVAPRLTDTHRVLTIDLFGHGESSKNAHGYSVNMFVEQIVSLLDALNIDGVTVIGHSMGGMVATALSLLAPERVEGAVLVNPAGMQPQILPFRAGGFFLLRRHILGELLPRTWLWILRQVFDQDNVWTRRFIRVCDETYDRAEVHAMAHLMETLRPDLLQRDYAEMLPELTIPVGLIWGEKDRLVPVRFLKKAAETLPNVTAESIENCGHMPNIERPDRINAFLDRALRR